MFAYLNKQTCLFLQSLEDIVTISLQIATSSTENKEKAVSVIEIETEAPPVRNQLLNAANRVNSLKVSISTLGFWVANPMVRYFTEFTFQVSVCKVKDLSKVSASANEIVLAFSNSRITEQNANFLNSSIRFMMCLTDKSTLAYSNIVVVAQFILKGTSYSLLRKVRYYFSRESKNIRVHHAH